MKNHSTGLTSIAAASCMLITACSPKVANIEKQALAKETPPDGVATAYLSVESHGATVADVYHVYLQASESDSVTEVLRADRAEGIRIEWVSRTSLAIRMDCGRVVKFKNAFYVQRPSDQLLQIAIVLDTRGPCDFSLPSR